MGKIVQEFCPKLKANPDQGRNYSDDIDQAMGLKPAMGFNPAANFEDIKTEIYEDLEVLNDYLKNSVFFAAGLLSYCSQELDRVKAGFLDDEEKWRKAVSCGIRRKHPPLMKVISFNTEEDFEFRRGIVVDLAKVQDLLWEVEGKKVAVE